MCPISLAGRATCPALPCPALPPACGPGSPLRDRQRRSVPDGAQQVLPAQLDSRLPAALGAVVDMSP